MSKTETTSTAKATETTKAKAPTRTAQYSADQKITLERTENPKRKGTQADRLWGLYKTGMTVGAFMKAAEQAGFKAARARSDLNYNAKVGFLKVS